MKYKKIAITAIVIIAITAVIIGYFCFASLSSSFGYDKGGNKGTFNENCAVPQITVIIDAGHGGIDPGAVANGLIEKELNLCVANKLKEFLLLSGVKTIMTREDDVLLGTGETVRQRKTADLKERLNILNSTENCIFVSIHMNKFQQESVHGLQTFYASSSQTADDLAENIQQYAKLLDPTNNRQIKPDDKNIYILENTSKTAVLVECGFLSNYSESKLLASNDYQEKTAFIIYCGIMKYLQENKNENTVYMY